MSLQNFSAPARGPSGALLLPSYQSRATSALNLMKK
jgi:hypothetical protein